MLGVRKDYVASYSAHASIPSKALNPLLVLADVWRKQLQLPEVKSSRGSGIAAFERRPQLSWPNFGSGEDYVHSKRVRGFQQHGFQNPCAWDDLIWHTKWKQLMEPALYRLTNELERLQQRRL
jgi:hypothetical protein